MNLRPEYMRVARIASAAVIRDVIYDIEAEREHELSGATCSQIWQALSVLVSRGTCIDNLRGTAALIAKGESR